MTKVLQISVIGLVSCDMHARMLLSAQVKMIGDTVYSLALRINPELVCIYKILTFVEVYINTTSAHEALQLDVMLKFTQSAHSTNTKLALSIKRCIDQSSQYVLE